MNIYMICTGNTCRSPMAEAILREKGLEGVEVRSAGIHALDGVRISPNAQQLIEEAGMPYTPVSNSLSEDNLEWADLVLTMTAAHRTVLHEAYPAMKHKIFTIREFVQLDGMEDVQDPFGGSLEIYRHTFNELVLIMDELERKLTEG
ncbi:low molecular weight protein arginine phosphatase [Sporosarcina sp. 179-K 3D1 HS]|uniref:low molecular weight protein arginine phosphatase n=1 Tax=Sporosarcina sp. 179-K 3D1 HS TaxID=3232169 RepID=UPI0039A118C7